MTGEQLSDPVLGPPTARSPWSATLCWSPEQNFGRVSLLTGRTSLGTVWGRLEAGESPEEVAKEFGLQVSAVHVVEQMRRELDDRALDAPCRDAEGECVNEREAADAWAEVPDRLKNGSRLSEAVRMLAGDRPPRADLVRAENVSGVRVEAGPSSPLVSPGPAFPSARRLQSAWDGLESVQADLDQDVPGFGSVRVQIAARIVEAQATIAAAQAARVHRVSATAGLGGKVHAADDPDVVVLDRSDWDGIKVIGERWPAVRAELQHLRAQTAPADLPATLASVDDVAAVCRAAGLDADIESTWLRWIDEHHRDWYVREEIKGTTFQLVGPTWGVTVSIGSPAAALWHAIQAARSAS